MRRDDRPPGVLRCGVCARPTPRPERGRCSRCYAYWYAHRVDRDPDLISTERPRGCTDRPCPWGCAAPPDPATYARAAAAAREHAYAYILAGRVEAAARAARSAAWLEERSEDG